MLINIIANIIYIFCVIFAILWGITMRRRAKMGQIERIFEVFGLLMAISLILIPILSLSPFHLLWMFPVSYILGMLSIFPPLRLLWPLASFYGSLWYVGLKSKRVIESKILEK